jgi:imidazolonepropionase-like amidohydrolase
MRSATIVLLSVLCLPTLSAQPSPGKPAAAPPPNEIRDMIRTDAPVIALTHARVIDGTGSAPRADQTIVISGGRIAAVGATTTIAIPEGAQILDLQGKSVMPGLVMLHEHMFYPTGKLALYNEHGWSFPRLYLAAGITTARTAGSVEPFTDLNLRKMIDDGKVLGPDLWITGPYLDGEGSFATQFHVLTGADDARQMVETWANYGATSFKAYMFITRDELGAAVTTAHKRGIKVTGHLCAVGFREAAALGIDNLEHGMVIDTEFVPGKKPDICPAQSKTVENFTTLDLKSAPVQEMIHDLVARHVAITSTLAVFEAFLPDRPPLQQRVLDAMTPEARVQYLTSRTKSGERKTSPWAAALKKEMEFERAFVAAGGLLLAGTDPTGNGGALAGFGSQREVELLVEAGFTPLEALRIASANGAEYLGISAKTGTIAVGKSADLVVVAGDPSENINDIEKTELVFKHGVGYDSAKLIESVKGSVGWR